MPICFLSAMWAVPLVCCAGDWRQFRGPDNRSASPATDLPTRFSQDENLAWKVALPGRGPSSPIVVGDRVFVTCSSGPSQDRLHVIGIDAGTGETLWQRQLWATGHTVCNPFSAVAANTPSSDGGRVFAFYSSNDVACFDLDGNLQWFRGLAHEFPEARNDAGMGSSPLVVGDTVVVQLENQGESFAAGLDVATGQTRWRIERERTATWTSPIVLRGETSEEDAVLLQSRSRLTAHAPRTGDLLWEYDIDCHTIASATTSGDVVYLPAGGLHALRYDPASGEVQELWHSNRLRSGPSSPVIAGGRVYVMKNPGIVVCGDLGSGDIVWQLRLEGPFWATPVVADGHLYAVNHGGLVQVVRLGEEEGEVVSTSQLDEGVLASPAVADEAVFFRTDQHLWKVSHDRQARDSTAAASTPRANSSSRIEEHYQPGAGLRGAG